MLTTIRCSIVVTMLALAAPASAQEVTRMPEGSRQSFGLDTGLEHALIARAKYVHRIDLGALSDARLYARATLPFVTPDLGDWAVDGGLRATPIAWGDLRLALMVGPVLRNTATATFSATALGAGATALFGYESARWGLSAEAGYEQMFATNLRHTDLYRDHVYAGAKDGWYALTGGTARGGLRGGVRFDAFEIFARAGVNTTGQLHAQNPPFYFTLGTAYAF
jgi:hypothetical protein